MKIRHAGALALALGASCHFVPVSAQTLSGATVKATQTINGAVAHSETGTTVLYDGPVDNDIYADAATGRISSMTSAFFSMDVLRRSNDIVYDVTFINNMPFSQRYAFDFTLNEGHLIDAVSAVSPGAATAELSAAVLLNGAQAWSTSAQCAGRQCSYTGTNIGYVEKLTSVGNGYDFARYDGSVSLGTLAPGQSVQIEYTVHTGAASIGLASGSVAVGPFSAFVANDFSGLGGVAVSPVPESPSVGLMSAGLLLITIVKIRRRQAIAQERSSR
ncbi:MAG TPA: hypothetical protein VFP68_13800 [Burkholderiaceae bacterium]|nr:hypothetical protein [Burkholderiaceae bacterium]